MIINQIYQDYFIPSHLQKHMLRVAAIGQFICHHVQIPCDDKSIITTLLLHDIANILKFDLDKGLDFFDPEERNLSYWQNVKSNLIKKYGSEEHQATFSIAKEIGVSNEVLFLLQNIGSSNLHKTSQSDDWDLKISSYSDFRVSPTGFVTVQNRFDDIIKRYKNRSHPLSDIEETKHKQDYCLKLEQQIQEKLDIDLQLLPITQLEQNSQKLLDFEI